MVIYVHDNTNLERSCLSGCFDECFSASIGLQQFSSKFSGWYVGTSMRELFFIDLSDVTLLLVILLWEHRRNEVACERHLD